MIFIVVKFTAKPEYRDTFLDEVGPFTAGTRSEEGVLWFDWSVSVDDPSQFVLVEAFRDGSVTATWGLSSQPTRSREWERTDGSAEGCESW